MEIWKQAKGYENYLEVSNMGNVRSIDRTVIVKDGERIYKRFFKGKQKTKTKNPKTGYLQIEVHHSKHVAVHRLVAETFIENPLNYQQVNHINFDRTDNRIENLEWCTNGQNTLHSMHRRKHKGVSPVISITTGKKYPSQTTAAKDVGTFQANISRSCSTNGRIRVKGQRFIFADCAGEIAARRDRDGA